MSVTMPTHPGLHFIRIELEEGNAVNEEMSIERAMHLENVSRARQDLKEVFAFCEAVLTEDAESLGRIEGATILPEVFDYIEGQFAYIMTVVRSQDVA